MIELPKTIKWNRAENFKHESKCGNFAVDNSLQDTIVATISQEVLAHARDEHKQDASLRKKEWIRGVCRWTGEGTVKFAKEHCAQQRIVSEELRQCEAKAEKHTIPMFVCLEE